MENKTFIVKKRVRLTKMKDGRIISFKVIRQKTRELRKRKKNSKNMKLKLPNILIAIAYLMNM